jgi:predicted nucleic acid-binding protein
MTVTLVDANILLDVVTNDRAWFGWSAGALAAAADSSTLAINPVVYAEVSIGFARVEDLEAALPRDVFPREPIPWEAAFLAGKCFLAYRRRGGTKRSPLPDFFIGAHAAVRGHVLLTRDPARYRTYFPSLSLVHPPNL